MLETARRGAVSKLHSSVLNGAALTLLIVGLGLAGLAIVSATHERRLIDDQEQTLVAAEHVLSTAKDLETGERGFAITGEDRYLQPYRRAVAELPAALAHVSQSQ